MSPSGPCVIQRRMSFRAPSAWARLMNVRRESYCQRRRSLENEMRVAVPAVLLGDEDVVRTWGAAHHAFPSAKLPRGKDPGQRWMDGGLARLARFDRLLAPRARVERG